MNFWKFLLYSGAIVITLGIISDDKEANQMVVDMLHDFEPRIVGVLKALNEMFTEKTYFDSDKIQLIASEKIRELDKHLTKIMSAFKDTDIPKTKKEQQYEISEMKAKLEALELRLNKTNKKTK